MKKLIQILFFIGIYSFSYGQLVVDETTSDSDLANLISGSGLTISNFTINSGLNTQYGSFGYTPDAILGLDTGLVISTGNLDQLVGINDNDGSTINNGIIYKFWFRGQY